MEVGTFFSALSEESFALIGGEQIVFHSGLGGRITLNLDRRFGLEGEVVSYPNLQLLTTTVGMKFFSAPEESVGVLFRIMAGFGRAGSGPQFVLDVGPGFEFLRRRHFGIRLDVGYLIMPGRSRDFLLYSKGGYGEVTFGLGPTFR